MTVPTSDGYLGSRQGQRWDMCVPTRLPSHVLTFPFIGVIIIYAIRVISNSIIAVSSSTLELRSINKIYTKNHFMITVKSFLLVHRNKATAEDTTEKEKQRPRSSQAALACPAGPCYSNEPSRSHRTPDRQGYPEPVAGETNQGHFLLHYFAKA